MISNTFFARIIILSGLIGHVYPKRGLLRRSPNHIELPVQPQCGCFNSDTFVNYNSGIILNQIKTIYSFGDSWTSNGKSDGSTAKPPLPSGSNPAYGGRASNGLMWTEYLTPKGMTLKNYAIGGSTVDRTLWTARANRSDMVSHVDTFVNQHLVIEAASALATIFYGVNDYGASRKGPGTMDQAASHLLIQSKRLVKAGITQFIIVSLFMDRPSTNNFNSLIWRGFKQMKQQEGIQFAYIDLRALWTAILTNPASFGYKNTGSCLMSLRTTTGGCNNPDDHLYWMPSHPQYQTQRLIAEWVRAVLAKCVS